MNFAKTIWNFTIHNDTDNLACQVFKFIKIVYKGNASKKNSPFDLHFQSHAIIFLLNTLLS
jgi:hypothetical protein